MIEGLILIAIIFIPIALIIWFITWFTKPLHPNKFYYIGSYDNDIPPDSHKKRWSGNIPKWIRDWIYDLNYKEGKYDYRKPNYNPSRRVVYLTDSEGITYLYGRYYSYKLQFNDIHKMIYIYKRKK